MLMFKCVKGLAPDYLCKLVISNQKQKFKIFHCKLATSFQTQTKSSPQQQFQISQSEAIEYAATQPMY